MQVSFLRSCNNNNNIVSVCVSSSFDRQPSHTHTHTHQPVEMMGKYLENKKNEIRKNRFFWSIQSHFYSELFSRSVSFETKKKKGKEERRKKKNWECWSSRMKNHVCSRRPLLDEETRQMRLFNVHWPAKSPKFHKESAVFLFFILKFLWFSSKLLLYFVCMFLFIFLSVVSISYSSSKWFPMTNRSNKPPKGGSLQLASGQTRPVYRITKHETRPVLFFLVSSHQLEPKVQQWFPFLNGSLKFMNYPLRMEWFQFDNDAISKPSAMLIKRWTRLKMKLIFFSSKKNDEEKKIVECRISIVL